MKSKKRTQRSQAQLVPTLRVRTCRHPKRDDYVGVFVSFKRLPSQLGNLSPINGLASVAGRQGGRDGACSIGDHANGPIAEDMLPQFAL